MVRRESHTTIGNGVEEGAIVIDNQGAVATKVARKGLG